MSKRDAEDDGGEDASLAVVKRAKADDAGSGASSRAIVRSSEGSIIATGTARTSDLEAPTMKVSGHKAAVTAAVFAPGGAAFASGALDGAVMLWNTFGPIASYGQMRHKKAVLALDWTADGAHVLSASADGSACAWDSETFERAKKTRDHGGSLVNDVSTCPGDPALFATVSNGGGARLWDMRHKRAACEMSEEFALLGVALSKDATLVWTAGVEGVARCWDARRPDAPLLELRGHREGITGASLSADGGYLLTHSRDDTVRVWDARPFSSRQNRCLKIFVGATHDTEPNLLRASWSPNGSRVAAGSADRCVYVFDTTSRDILYKLPGHRGVVNTVVWHPTQPVILSAGADKTLFLGELQE